MTNNTNDTDDKPVDIVSITSDDRSAANIKSNLLQARLGSRSEQDIEFGIEIHQDGPDIALSAGTTWTPDDGPELYTYHGLTTEQAREIASGLMQAAEKAEEAHRSHSAEEPEREGLLERLMP